MIEFIQGIENFQMWYTLGVITVAIVLYANDKVSMELTSLLIISSLAVFYNFFPVINADGVSTLSTQKLFMGFSNTALLAVVSLLILGQAVIQTGMLNNVVSLVLKIGGNNPFITIGIVLIFVFFISSILNNTPVVVIFIPIMAALARKMEISVSKVMIPLSFASILGGMTTLIGSSTNLLVSGVLTELGQGKLGFFEFTIPGLYIAGVGLAFVIFVVPFLLKDRASFVKSYSQDNDNRQFVAQLEVGYSSDLVGKNLEDGIIPGFKEVAIKMVLRGEHAILAPFDDNVVIRPNDIIIVTASKTDLASLFAKHKDLMDRHMARLSESDEDAEDAEDMMMAEIVVAPGSRILNQTLEQMQFHHKYDSTVLAIQRQSRMLRSRVSDIRLQAGDVLLVMGSSESIFGLQETKDFLLMEWSAETFQTGSKAIPTALVFGGAIALAGFGILPIAIGAFLAVGPPIAVNLAMQLGIDVKVFVYAVIFACNCSFLTPIGYQTNLMVMGPGHYQFADFTKSGLPIAIIVMAAYLAYTWAFYL